MKTYDQHKMKRTQIREDQVKAGFFDGRFVSRVEESKNTYTRKIKHKKQFFV
jgi:stalled ribosome alternative rescue factor ArfA